MKTYRKPNGDLNIDIEALVKEYPEIVGATDDDAEQRVIGTALVPYLIEEINNLKTDANLNLAILVMIIITELVIHCL